jgi:hypothetical protein
MNDAEEVLEVIAEWWKEGMEPLSPYAEITQNDEESIYTAVVRALTVLRLDRKMMAKGGKGTQ